MWRAGEVASFTFDHLKAVIAFTFKSTVESSYVLTCTQPCSFRLDVSEMAVLRCFSCAHAVAGHHACVLLQAREEAQAALLEERKTKQHLEEQLQHSSLHAADISAESKYTAHTISQLQLDIAMLHKASQELQEQQQTAMVRLETQLKAQALHQMQQLEATHSEEIRRLDEEHAQEVHQLEEEHRRRHRTQAQMGEEAVSSARRISTQEVLEQYACLCTNHVMYGCCTSH